MIFDEFLSRLNEAGIQTNPYCPFNLDKLFRYAREKRQDGEPILIQWWETGGVRGGSCWENSNPQPYTSSEPPPTTFKELDKVLELFAPNITFLQYRRLSEIIQTGNETDWEYYGNCTTYAYQLVLVKDLFDKMISMGLLQ